MSTFALTITAPGVTLALPRLVAAAGEAAAHHTLEFFTARIPNTHTREAYGRAVARFCGWCDEHSLALTEISSPIVAAYLAALEAELSVLPRRLDDGDVSQLDDGHRGWSSFALAQWPSRRHGDA